LHRPLKGRDKLVKGPTTGGLTMLWCTAGTVSYMNMVGMLPTNISKWACSLERRLWMAQS
jgi:hypothetical protein